MDLQAVATGLIVGVVVALVTFRLSANLERERWQREDRIRQEDLDRQADERWANERRELFGRFIRNEDDLVDSSRRLYDGLKPLERWRMAWDDGYQAAVEISLIEPDLGDAAEAMHLLVADLHNSAWQWARLAADARPEPEPEDTREAAITAAERDFLLAAQANLRPRRHVPPPER